MATVDVRPVLDLADLIGKLGGERLGEVVVESLNEAGESAYELSQKRILRGVNLTEEYVKRRLEKTKATKGRPTYVIESAGSNTTSLGHYGALVNREPVNWTNDRIKRFGPWPGWTRRQGDDKQAGVSVEVTRGNRKELGGSNKPFIIPGGKFKDKSGNPLIFRGTGNPGRSKGESRPGHPARKKPRQAIEALYGPSVYQLFRSTIPLVRDEIEDDIENRLLANVEAAIQEVFD